MITDIYRIKTMNSFYEVRVFEDGRSACRKAVQTVDGIPCLTADSWKQVTGDTEYLQKLYIGASFDVPGVVTTSVVQDYNHMVQSTEPKRNVKDLQGQGIQEFFGDLAGALVAQVKNNVREAGRA